MYHHISTIEGGFIATDDLELYELLVAMRSHGWSRDLSVDTQLKLQAEWNVSEFDSLYTFYYSGYNFRSTDLQAYIGLSQIDKLEKWGSIRARNFELYQKLIENDYWKPDIDLNDFISNFAYPIIHPDRDLIVDELKNNKVEVRPMICGSMGTQPFYAKKYGKLYLDNVTEVDTFGFYVPNHPKLTEDEIKFICNIVNRYTL